MSVLENSQCQCYCPLACHSCDAVFLPALSSDPPAFPPLLFCPEDVPSCSCSCSPSPSPFPSPAASSAAASAAAAAAASAAAASAASATFAAFAAASELAPAPS